MGAQLQMINRRRLLAYSTAAYATTLAGIPLRAYSEVIQKNLRVVVGFPAGGTADVLARLFAEKLRGNYAPVVLVENKAGAGGRIALANAGANDADGSVAFILACSLLTIYPHVYKKLQYDPVQDFAPVSTIARGDFAFSVGPAVPDAVTTLSDFVKWAKANPKQAFFASPAAGATPHFVGLMFARAAGIELTHASYKGDAPGIQDLMGGQVASSVNNIGVVLPHVKSGRIRILATSGTKRSRFTPSVPTFAEAGFKDVVGQEWFGFVVPTRTPPEIVEKFASTVAEVVKTPTVAERLAEFSFEPIAIRTKEFAALLKSDRDRWDGIVKASGFRLDE
jgi:tripartite-type tricarboxylate transporter receptor subunit TctC